MSKLSSMVSADQFAIPAAILRHFDLSSSPWNAEVVESCLRNRQKSYEGKLFFDRLLDIAGLQGQSLYPPKAPADIRRLLHAIHSTGLDRLKKDCYFYYLLRDYDARAQATPANGHVEGMEVDDEDGVLVGQTETHEKRAEVFAERRCMPRNWRVFMDGYWALDNRLWELAVDSLSDPSISEVNFVPEIIQTLSNSVSPPRASCSLIHNFITYTQPELSNDTPESDIRLLAIASSTTLTETFNTIRLEKSAEQKGKMREVVWCWILGAPRMPCGSGKHVLQPKALKELLHIPLLPEEESHLISFLSRPPRSISSSSLSQLHDLVTQRLLHQGHYNQTLQLDKKLAGSGAGTQEDRQRRRTMVREFISALPECHKRVLLADVESNLKREEKEVNGHAEDVEMGASWLQVNGVQESPVPSPPTPASAPAYGALSTSAVTPIRPSGSSSSLAHIARAVASTAAPAQPERTVSPFAGPPRFAPATSTSASPRQNQTFTGSPFTLPSNATAARAPKSSPKKPRPKNVINDDHEEEEAVVRGSVRGKGGKAHTLGQASVKRSTRQPSLSAEPEEQGVDENHPIDAIDEDTAWSPPPAPPALAEEPKSIRRTTRRVASGTHAREKTPPSPPRRSTRARQSATPGAISSAMDVEPPARRTRGASAHPDPMPTPSTRSRMTRSVSRALADSDHSDADIGVLPIKRIGNGAPASARKKRRGSVAASEITEDGEGQTPKARRSTRRTIASPTPGLPGSEKGTGTRKKKEIVTSTKISTRSRRG